MSDEEMKFTDVLDVPYFHDDLWKIEIQKLLNKKPKTKKKNKSKNKTTNENELLKYLEKIRNVHGEVKNKCLTLYIINI